MPDNWKHRSTGMKCHTCMWYAVKVTVMQDNTATQIGRCRKHAPTMTGYPVVFSNDWCGDHKLNEEML